MDGSDAEGEEIDEENDDPTIENLYEPTEMDVATWRFVEWRRGVSLGAEDDTESGLGEPDAPR